jgi:16S rRNA processing protein RimM
VHGELRIRLLTDRPDRFAGLEFCVLWDPRGDERRVVRIERARRQGDGAVVKLAGVDDPAAARRLTGRLLAVVAAQALAPAPGYLYPWQLEGCRVETEGGVRVGAIARVEHGRAQDLWVVVDGRREHLIPAVREIVALVDLEARRVVIRPPDGLLEL